MAKIEDLVLTIDQMNHLEELGVEVENTALCWVVGELSFQDVKVKHQAVVATNSNPQKYGFIKNVIPTLTLQEILEMLPEEIRTDDNDRAFLIYDKADENISYNTEDCDGSLKIEYVSFRYGENILVDAYNALCWCAENGYLNNK